MSGSQNQNNSGWSSREAYLLAMVALFVGLIAGFLLNGSNGPRAVTAAPTSAPAPAAASPVEGVGSMQTPEQLNVMVQPMLDAAKANPKDPGPLVQLGNTYYDHRFYPEAIKYYGQALALKPDDPDVRTDMGTAMFYAGSPDKAVAELQKVLKTNPKHVNALFNLGVIQMDGLHNNKAAISTWERLLAGNPDYPNKQKVQELIAKAKSQS